MSEVRELIALKNLKGHNLHDEDFAHLDWIVQPIGIDKNEKHYDLSGYADCLDYGLENESQEVSDSDDEEEFDKGRFYTKSAFVHDFDDGFPYGIICHKRCKEILRNYLDYEIRFADVFPHIYNENFDIRDAVTEINHEDIKPYSNQFFEFEEMISDKKDWLIQDPVENERNRERIVRSWAPLVHRIKNPDADVDITMSRKDHIRDFKFDINTAQFSSRYQHK